VALRWGWRGQDLLQIYNILAVFLQVCSENCCQLPSRLELEVLHMNLLQMCSCQVAERLVNCNCQEQEQLVNHNCPMLEQQVTHNYQG